MKVEDPISPSGTMVSPQNTCTPERRRVLIAKLYQVSCPKCNNKTDFYRYGKDVHGHQKYQCKKCWHQFAVRYPGRQCPAGRVNVHPRLPRCVRKRCIHYSITDKKCNHSVFVPKANHGHCPIHVQTVWKDGFQADAVSVVYVILMALTMFYQGKNSFRNIALILRTAMNVQVSHTIISNWCTRFDPTFLFFYNFVRPHSALNNLTPAQCAGLQLSKKRKRRKLLLVA